MESLKTYPVRSDGENILVQAQADPAIGDASGPILNHPVFLLVYAGAEGSMVAKRLRQSGFTGSIVVVDP